MEIGILGSGSIGGTAARLFTRIGHSVMLSNSRGPESLTEQVQQIGGSCRAATVAAASQAADLVLVAIPFGSYRSLQPDLLAGRIVIDSMNYFAQRDVGTDPGDLTSSELVARHLPEARLVKAFNTMYWQTLATEGRQQAPLAQRLTLFVAGDDAAAKQVVAVLITAIGFAPLDTGSLAAGGRLQQPGSPLFNQPLTLTQAQAWLAAQP